MLCSLIASHYLVLILPALGKLRGPGIPIIQGIIFCYTSIDCVRSAPLTGCARTSYLQSCKIGCAIGACGACTVFVTSSPATGKNPCLRNADRISWLRRPLLHRLGLPPPALYTLPTLLALHSPHKAAGQMNWVELLPTNSPSDRKSVV